MKKNYINLNFLSLVINFAVWAFFGIVVLQSHFNTTHTISLDAAAIKTLTALVNVRVVVTLLFSCLLLFAFASIAVHKMTTAENASHGHFILDQILLEAAAVLQNAGSAFMMIAFFSMKWHFAFLGLAFWAIWWVLKPKKLP